MRIKLDENLPVRLIDLLTGLGHNVDSVPIEGLAGEPDETVWRAASHADRFFITQDLDFSDARRYAPGTHPGVLVLRLRQPGRTALIERVSGFFKQEDVETLTGCFVILTETKARIRRPESAS